MSNELQITGSMRFTKAPTTAAIAISFFVDVAGSHVIQDIADIGTTEEVLDKGDIGTIGFITVRNLDATNYVEVGKTTGVYNMKIGPGEAGIIPWGYSIAPFCKANTASCKVEYLMVEV